MPKRRKRKQDKPKEPEPMNPRDTLIAFDSLCPKVREAIQGNEKSCKDIDSLVKLLTAFGVQIPPDVVFDAPELDEDQPPIEPVG